MTSNPQSPTPLPRSVGRMSGIVPATPQPWALEARFMFDGDLTNQVVQVQIQEGQLADAAGACCDAAACEAAESPFAAAYAVTGASSNGGNDRGIVREPAFVQISTTATTIEEIRFVSAGGGKGSANDSLVRLTIDGETYFAWISGKARLDRDGDTVGYYLWFDPSFTTEEDAQLGRIPGKRDEGEPNRAYILATVKLTFADWQTDNNVQINSNPEGLEALFAPANQPPQAANDVQYFDEDAVKVTGNVITDSDTDPEQGALSVTSFTIDGVKGKPDTPTLIPGVGIFTMESNGSYTLEPMENFYGPVPEIQYTVANSKGCTDTATLSLIGTASPDAPTSTDDVVTTDEDTPVVLGVKDFGTFYDPDVGDTLQAVRITVLPKDGLLQHWNGSAWVNVAVNQEFSVADLDAKKLRMKPADNASGSPYASAKFQVNDGTNWSAEDDTVTFNVISSPDAPPSTDLPAQPNTMVWRSAGPTFLPLNAPDKFEIGTFPDGHRLQRFDSLLGLPTDEISLEDYPKIKPTSRPAEVSMAPSNATPPAPDTQGPRADNASWELPTNATFQVIERIRATSDKAPPTGRMGLSEQLREASRQPARQALHGALARSVTSTPPRPITAQPA